MSDKTGNYEGWSDRGYKRDSSDNGNRLIEKGLVLYSPPYVPTTTSTPPKTSVDNCD